MTIGAEYLLVKPMRLTNIQVERMVRRVLHDLQERKLLIFKTKEDAVVATAVKAVLASMDREKDLDSEARMMVEKLEKQNAEPFDRHKMFLLIKKKLAKDRGIIL